MPLKKSLCLSCRHRTLPPCPCLRDNHLAFWHRWFLLPFKTVSIVRGNIGFLFGPIYSPNGLCVMVLECLLDKQMLLVTRPPSATFGNLCKSVDLHSLRILTFLHFTSNAWKRELESQRGTLNPFLYNCRKCFLINSKIVINGVIINTGKTYASFFVFCFLP